MPKEKIKNWEKGKLFLELKIGEVFTKEKSDKLMAYLKWFIDGKVAQEKEKLLERIDKMPEIVEMREGKEIKLGWIDKKKLKEEIKIELKR